MLSFVKIIYIFTYKIYFIYQDNKVIIYFKIIFLFFLFYFNKSWKTQVFYSRPKCRTSD